VHAEVLDGLRTFLSIKLYMDIPEGGVDRSGGASFPSTASTVSLSPQRIPSLEESPMETLYLPAGVHFSSLISPFTSQ